ncbi:MAG: phosphocholine cytidylyltransferase family protein [Alphaproteobacteria bacterium]|nr:phosphocholine cytidylyltransferase family protein [Alphaproteobacteria bacterium]
MRGLILAAGRGSRLKDRTEDRPKGLVALNGHPLIAWQLHALRGAGIDDIALVGGYRSDSLKQFNLPIFENPRWAETNMVRSFMCAADWMTERPVIVSYSDIVYDASTVARLAADPAEIAISFDPDWLTLWSARFADPLSDAETFRLDGRDLVIDIGRKPKSLDEIRGQYMGLLKFTPTGWRTFAQILNALPTERCDKLDMTSTLRLLIEHGTAIKAVPAAGPWAEVDNEIDLALYAKADSPIKLPPGPV